MFPSCWMFWKAIAWLRVWSTAGWMETPSLKIASTLSRNSTAPVTLTYALCLPCECGTCTIPFVISHFVDLVV